MNDNSGLYFIVGALVVAVAGLGLYFGGFVGNGGGGSESKTTIERTITPDSSSTTIKKEVNP